MKTKAICTKAWKKVTPFLLTLDKIFNMLMNFTSFQVERESRPVPILRFYEISNASS